MRCLLGLLTEQCAACPVSRPFSLYTQHVPLRPPGGHAKRKGPPLLTSVKKTILWGICRSRERQGIQLGTFVGVGLSAIPASADVATQLQQPFSNSFHFESLFSPRLHSPMCAVGLARPRVPRHICEGQTTTFEVWCLLAPCKFRWLNSGQQAQRQAPSHLASPLNSVNNGYIDESFTYHTILS